jgi:sensor histidine kinase YesM
MSHSTPPPSISPIKCVPLFWQLQLLGWVAFTVISFPLKQAAYGSFSATALFTAYQLPLAIFLTAALREFYHRARLARYSYKVAVSIALVATVVASTIDVSISLRLNRLLEIRPLNELTNTGLYTIRAAIYFMWSLGYFLIKALLQNREQSFANAVSEERHRFELLRYQLNPAFLAKSLNTITREATGNARVMTSLLADYYRQTVRQSDQRKPATLGDEIALLRAYLEIERLHRPESLHLHFHIDESLLNEPLPPVLILPLAEKALKAGGGTPLQPLEITVTVQRSSDSQVLIEVAYSGRLSDTSAPKTEPGTNQSDITDVQAALERHYPGRHKLSFTEDSFTARATLVLPLTA